MAAPQPRCADPLPEHPDQQSVGDGPAQWVERSTALEIAGQLVERILPAAALKLAPLSAHRAGGKLTGLQNWLRRNSAAPGSPQHAIEPSNPRQIPGSFTLRCSNK